MPQGSALKKEMKCSEELQEITKTKKISRGALMKLIWKYIDRKGLKGEEDGRVIQLDDRLEAVINNHKSLRKLIKEKRNVENRGKKIKVPKGHIFFTELASALSKNLE